MKKYYPPPFYWNKKTDKQTTTLRVADITLDHTIHQNDKGTKIILIERIEKIENYIPFWSKVV